jgi:cardiolipin synthase A/B
MELIVQPDDGWMPLTKALQQARSSIDIVIFRFDAPRLERELEAAVNRGVVVRALVAHTNKNGGKKLRELEDRLLGYGVTVDRTADDLVRYHGKLLVIDKRRVFVLGFNYTREDIQTSRSFGVIAANRRIVQEVTRLIVADARRETFETELPTLVVSPENSRVRLAAFIKRATQELLIYDPKINDRAMIELIDRRARAGVRVRILGKLKNAPRADNLHVEDFPRERLHVRAIIRDGRQAFIGSQSLGTRELDDRREVGIIVRDRKVVSRLMTTFDADWALTAAGKRTESAHAPQSQAV